MKKTYSEMSNRELIHELAANQIWDLVLCLEVFERAGLEDSFDPSMYRSPFWSEEYKTLFDSLMGRALLCLVKQGEDYCPLDDECPRGWLADLEKPTLDGDGEVGI